MFYYLVLILFSHLYIYFIKESKYIDPYELFFGISYVFFLIAWMLRITFYQRRQLMNKSIDLFFSLLAISMLVSLIIAFFNGNDMFKAIRELLPFLIYFIYFPIIDLTDSEKKIKILISTFIALFVIVAFKNHYYYWNIFFSAKLLYELTTIARQTQGEIFFLIMSMVSISSFMFAESFKMKLFSFVSIVLFFSSLVLTFTRGIWVGFFIAIIALFILSNNIEKRKMIYYFSLLMIPFIIYIYLNNDVNNFFVVAIDRLLTLSPPNILSNYSLMDKIEESRAILNEIIKNPIAGYGLGATFSFFTQLRGFLIDNWYAHNFYLFIWFKLGLLGLISFLILFYNCFKIGFFLLDSSKINKYRPLILGIISSLIGITIVSIALPDLFSRGGILGMVFILSIITLLEKKYTSFY